MSVSVGDYERVSVCVNMTWYECSVGARTAWLGAMRGQERQPPLGLCRGLRDLRRCACGVLVPPTPPGCPHPQVTLPGALGPRAHTCSG